MFRSLTGIILFKCRANVPMYSVDSKLNSIFAFYMECYDFDLILYGDILQ